MTAAGKSFEVRIADLVRLLGSEFEGEVLNAHGALKRLLASRSVGFTDLGNAIEKLATGGLDDDQMRRLFDAGYQKGLEEAMRKQVEAEAAFGLRPDGTPDWESNRALLPKREEAPQGGPTSSIRRRHGVPHDVELRADAEAGDVSAVAISPTRREGQMTVAVDEDAVREFITIVSEHAAELAKSNGKSGVLQLTRLSPADEKLVPTRFKLDSVDDMVRAAIADANASHNVYIEGRTVRADLRGAARGTLADTEFVFGLVVDVDHDKGKGGAVTVRPSLTIETSPGNLHLWYLLTQPLAAGPAKALGDAIRVATGTDQDTGVVSQPYRVPGTPNFPSKAKRARGRLSVEPTRIVEHSGRLWDPDELKAAFAAQAPAPSAPSARGRSGAAAPTRPVCRPSSCKTSVTAASALGSARRRTSRAPGSSIA